MQYRAGMIEYIEDGDPLFDTMLEANDWIMKQGSAYLEVFFGIWADRDEGGELLRIVYLGEVFEK